MKKFLSILLALAVGFTFTFGSAMSAFATVSYTTDDVNNIIDAAYQSAVATAFDVDYDTINDTDNNAANAITVFTIDKAAVQAGIYAAYQYAKTSQTSTPSTTDVKITSTETITLSNESKAAAIAQLRLAFETAAVSGGAYVNDSYEAAFDAYKAYLTSVVNAISTENYTTTNYKNVPASVNGGNMFTAKNGNSYETSKEAADADKQWALDAIAKAKFATAGLATAASTTDTWKTNITHLYEKVFGEVFTIVLNKDDVTDPNKVTSVSYKMSGSYSTTAIEKQNSATLEVKKAQAKATLVSVITTFEVGTAYKPAYANAIAAYKECMEYLIDNATTDPTSLVGKAIVTATSTTVALETAIGSATADTPINYIDRTVAAAQAKADAATNKQIAGITGDYYDDAKADKALVDVLLQIYAGYTYDSSNQTANGMKLYGGVAALTAGQKAEYKAEKDYSEVEANANGLYKFKTYNNGGSLPSYNTYYAKEFEAVKAAADAYCTAIDAAVNMLDVDKAEKAYKEATLAKNIKNASQVKGIFTSLETSVVGAYFNKVKKANGNIYVTWNNGESYDTTFNSNNYKAWVIDKGARTLKEADALYTDACAVIDAFKTKSQLTTEAAAVQTKIAALPATITLADKAAVADAYKAYKALPENFRPFVANSSTLKAAVKKLENLDAAEVIKLINALPALSKVTVADKAAIKAAAEAYKTWNEEDTYQIIADGGLFIETRTSVTNITATGNYTDKLQTAERQALIDAYVPLGAKWSQDKITAEDAAAVKALQEATAAYIAEYNEALDFEANLTKIAALVDSLTKWTDEDAKAYVQDLSIAVRTAKVGKKVKVTVNADVQTLIDNGYTVTYKFYKSTKKGSGYKNTVNKTTNTYTNTNPVKGKNYYKVKLVVKNADGTVVATTPLTQCKYGVRTMK